MIQYRKLIKKDINEVALLITGVYEKYCKDEASKNIIDNFKSNLNPQLYDEKNLYNKIKRNIMFVASDNNKIIGVIIGDLGKINKLFVDGNYHKQGIAKKLYNLLENKNKKMKVNEIKVKSSIYALKFYQKQGFKKTTGLRNYYGMSNFPMKKKLS